MSEHRKSAGEPSPLTLSRCLPSRQPVARALQKGSLSPEGSYTQLQGRADANGWEQTADTVEALLEEKEWKTRG